MKRKLVATTLCLGMMFSSLTGVTAMATTAEPTTEAEKTADDEFDLSEDQEKIAELGIPTVTSVSKLHKEADDLFVAKDYKKAASAYNKYAKHANYLANILSGTLEPYYSASYDDKKSFSPFDGFYDMADAEAAANKYKSERNRAMLNEGLCYYYGNEYGTALPLLLKALDLIEIDQTDYWKEGYNAVASIVGFTTVQ